MMLRARAVRLYTSLVTPEFLPARLRIVKEKLELGLEWSSSVRDSANQLMLEHDPASRHPASHYLMHYQSLARGAVVSALEEYQALREQIGGEEMDEILKSEQAGDKSLRMLVADSMLARDRLEAALKKGEAKLQSNEVECQ